MAAKYDNSATLDDYTVQIPKIGVLDQSLMIAPPKDDKATQNLDDYADTLASKFKQMVDARSDLSITEHTSIVEHGTNHIYDNAVVSKIDGEMATFACKVTEVRFVEKHAAKDGRVLGVKAQIVTDEPAYGGDGVQVLQTDWVEYNDSFRPASTDWDVILGSSIALIAQEAVNSDVRVFIKRRAYPNPTNKGSKITKIIGIGVMGSLKNDVFALGHGGGTNAPATLSEDEAWDVLTAVDPDGKLCSDEDAEPFVQALTKAKSMSKVAALALSFGANKAADLDEDAVADLIEGLPDPFDNF